MHKSLAALVLAAGFVTGQIAGHAAETRSFAAGNLSLKLDGVPAGSLLSVEGGAISAPVIESPFAGSLSPEKHIGQPTFEAFSLRLGFGNPPEIYDWIASAWNGGIVRKNGSIVAADFKLEVKAEREFFNA